MAETAVAITRFVRKPLQVDAIQVTEQNFAAVAIWCRGSIESEDGSEIDYINDQIDPTRQFIRVKVSNPVADRHTKAFIGDWVVRVRRSYKVYTRTAFANAFDVVAEE